MTSASARPRQVVAALLVAAVVAAACGATEEVTGPTTSADPETTAPRPAGTTTTTLEVRQATEASEATPPEDATTAPAPPPPTTATPTTAPAGLAGLAGVRTRLTRVATLDAPLAMATRQGHSQLYVAERAGRVRMLDGLTAPVILDIRADTTTDGERGLLGLAFSPGGERLYISYTDRQGHSHIDEFTMGPSAGAVDIGSRRTVLQVDQPYSNHNGGNIVFGPDGMLWFGLGDGGSGGDPHDHGQNPRTLLGSLLRIDPRADGTAQYRIPPGNPFSGGDDGRREVWAYGLRNPWRFSFDRATGDLWIADVGQSAVEEINLLRAGTGAGSNLGWARLEGSRRFSGSPPPDHVLPIFEYPNDSSRCSVTGGFVYRGDRIPGLRGAYVYADLCEATVRALLVRDGRVADERAIGGSVTSRTLASFGEGGDGTIYVLSVAGGVFRLDPA